MTLCERGFEICKERITTDRMQIERKKYGCGTGAEFENLLAHP